VIGGVGVGVGGGGGVGGDGGGVRPKQVTWQSTTPRLLSTPEHKLYSEGQSSQSPYVPEL